MNTHTSQDTPFIPAPWITTVAGYLLTRLAEAGLASVFGVPGDDNLGILDAIADRPDLAWIGMATEQGAGYAADSYARLRGIGALVTTFGVGELSALNAIAGAYAESVPVVHIVGTPALAAIQTGTTRHHNLPGRDYGHFARMAAEVTAAQADLRPDTAPEEIDRVLSTALRTSRPVYLTIPADVAGIPVLAPAGRLPRAAGDADPAVVAAFTGRARRMLAAAASASLLVGYLASRHRVTAQVRDLAIAGDLPVAVLPEAKGDFPESDPRFAGLYAGPDPYPSAKRARVAVEDADVLITVGVTLADTILGGAHQLPEGRRIVLDPGQACIDGIVYPGIGMRQSLAILAAAVRSMPRRPGRPAAVRSRAGCPRWPAHPWQPVGSRAGPPASRRPADRRPGHRVLRCRRAHPARRGPAARSAAVGLDRLGPAGRAGRVAGRAGPARGADRRPRGHAADRGRARHPARPGPGADRHRAQQRRRPDRAGHPPGVRRIRRVSGLGLDRAARRRRPGLVSRGAVRRDLS